MGFDLLREELRSAIAKMDWSEPTPIQASALPALLKGRDVLGQARTGTGKTGAFGLAVLQRLRAEAVPQALVLCPTRELADQVAQAIRQMAAQLSNTRVVVLTGGRPMRGQRQALERGAHVLVGTPGRVLRHLEQDTLRPDALQCLVLDEADRMLDMGFFDQVAAIGNQCPPGQRLLFSATVPEEVLALSRRIQRDAVHLRDGLVVEEVRQLLVRVPSGRRKQTVAEVLAWARPEQALVFCETRSDCDGLARFLTGRGARALPLHGLMEQRDRDDVLVQFRNGSATVLVATNVASRGLDIDGLPLVIIAELSGEPDSHVHRIGRTGRAGHPGQAVSIVCPREAPRLERIEELFGALPEAPPFEGSGLAHLEAPNRTLLLLAGRRDKLRPGDVLGALVKDAGLQAEHIGRIDVGERSTAVAIRRCESASVASRKTLRVKKRKLRLRLLG